MDYEEVCTQLAQISVRLQEDGVPAGSTAEERQCHLWRELLHCEAQFSTTKEELQVIRTQQASEMKEVESYVAHIRELLEERECLTADYERDNEQLRLELHQLRQQQESQSKEMEELLAQEDLGEMGLSSPSEQVAYLLVERATLLERLEAAERRLDSQNLTGNLAELHLQEELEHIRRAMGEELRQKREDVEKTADDINKAHTEISRERIERQRLERDLEEASRRLGMAHQDIRRLTNELDAARRTKPEPGGHDLQGTFQEVEHLREEVDKLKHCDMMKLQRSKEENEILDAENRVLRDRVRTLECEKKSILESAKKDADQSPPIKDDQRTSGSDRSNNVSSEENDQIHKRCRESMEDGLVQMKELQRQLQRQRQDKEELEERNEELEALLGEAQNASKGDRHRHEGELEGLHRRIKNLEGELKKQDVQVKLLKNGDEMKTTESYLQLHLRDSSQERLALLEARLTEEKDWRKQLEVDLGAAQTALKKDKDALQIGERELKKLRLEVKSLQTECQQGKTLIKSLTQVKGEKAVLEEKMAQLERAHSRLQTELGHYKNADQTQDDLKENRLQVKQLQEQADRLTAELSALQVAHSSLREEMAAERQRSVELHAELSSSVQEKLAAEGERERLSLEVQRLRQQLLLQQEQITATTQALERSQSLDLQKAQAQSTLSAGEEASDESLDQELNHRQTLEERQLSSQHQLALQAQVHEAQARIKLQDSMLSQKAEEAKQLKQDVHRAQGLFTSAERELRYEKEKNTDLKRHNTLLEQEKLKLSAELKQAQTKLAQVEQRVQTQAADVECKQHRIRELELELVRTSTTRNSNSSLQEELQAERTRLIAADKKVLELQQQLKNVQHQLRVEEARAEDSSRLERDSRDLTDTLSALRAQQQEEHIARKLLERREEELQQQVRSFRLKEASLTRTNSELGHRVQQLDTRLTVQEAELSKARDQDRESQKLIRWLQEEQSASQQESSRLQEELQQVLLQLDTNIRKYNEKQNQHKTKLRQAKQMFLKTVAQRDRTIQKLENDLGLASSLAQKEKEWIQTVTEENEKLLEERRELLQKISEAEEMGSSGMRTASTLQHRVSVLELENRQLQERTLKLSNQVSSLERALRNAQSFYGPESVKMLVPSASLCDAVLRVSSLSLTSGSCDPLDILDAVCHVKAGESAALEGVRASVSTPPPQPPSEQGYLNLNSPAAPPGSRSTEQNSANGDEV